MIKYITICIVCMLLLWCSRRETNTLTNQPLSSSPTQCLSAFTDGSYNCSLVSWTGIVGEHLNILWQPLQWCSTDPVTGFERDGYCKTWPQDPANHSVCAVLTDEFLQYTLTQGNDLITPNPRYQFPWLKAWDRWCLCAARWYEAQQTWITAQIVTWATHISTLKDIPSSVFWL